MQDGKRGGDGPREAKLARNSATRSHGYAMRTCSYPEFDVRGAARPNESRPNATEGFECSKMARCRGSMICAEDVPVEGCRDNDEDKGVLVWGNRLSNNEPLSRK